MLDLSKVGDKWIVDEVDSLTDEVIHISPSQYNEENRYLPASVTSMPGYIRYAVNPYMREIVDCFDIDSPVREVSLKKGVQITYSTVLESGVLYFADHVKTLPMMYITADKELAEVRIENYFLPMFNHSGKGHIIRTSDEGNTRKTGKTKKQLQFVGGGFLTPFGARNADKMRQASICIMLKDEIDGWPLTVGKDGDPEALSTARCDSYWEQRKIFRGSTPLLKGTSKIQKAYLKGDQRKYHVLCKSCGYPQELRWETKDKETGLSGGFQWETDEGVLVIESVRYCCQKCGHAHYEHDKEQLFSEEHGAKWIPTAKPVEPSIRSYHLPALYSPVGMKPWYACVLQYLDGYDPKSRKVIDIPAFQVFYNNILAEPFEVVGNRIRKESVSGHRRVVYRLGQIPNEYSAQYSGSKILFVTCQVDVHDKNLAVATMGWTRDARCYLIDYWRFEIKNKEPYCIELSSPVWQRLRDLLEEKIYTADDGQQYRILMTFIDAGHGNATVSAFCADYVTGVYPILGRPRGAKNQTIKEFAEFSTQAGTVGYKITVDHYKDRMAPVLRRDWREETGQQPAYHFNAPVDTTDKQLEEFTKEYQKKVVDPNGFVSYPWDRVSGADNELWDLLIYGSCAVEILAWQICIQYFELETIDWHEFWAFAESPENDELFGRVAITK